MVIAHPVSWRNYSRDSQEGQRETLAAAIQNVTDQRIYGYKPTQGLKPFGGDKNEIASCIGYFVTSCGVGCGILYGIRRAGAAHGRSNGTSDETPQEVDRGCCCGKTHQELVPQVHVSARPAARRALSAPSGGSEQSERGGSSFHHP